MADNPFDQTNYGLRERPVSADWNQLSSQLYMTIREAHRYIHDARVSAGSSAAQSISGFHGAGLRVVPSTPAGMSVAVSAGLGFMFAPTDIPTDLGATDLESVDDRSPYKPLIVQTPQTFNVPVAPSSPNSRIDIIEVRNPRRLENAIPRRQLDPNTLQYDDHIFNKTLAFQIDNLQCGTVTDPSPSTAPLSYKTGTSGNPGLVPPTTPGYIKIAEVLVPNGATSIGAIGIIDRRALLFAGGVGRFSGRWRVQWNSGSPTATAIAIAAPPGIDVTFTPVGLRGAGSLFVVGGQIQSAAVTITAAHQHGHDFTDRFSVGLQATNGFTGSQVIACDGSTQTALAAGSPPVIAALGCQVVAERIISRFVTNTGASNNTDTSLEDAIISAVGTLTYW